MQEGSDCTHALVNRPPPEQLALGRDRVAKQDLATPQTESVGDALEKGIQNHTPRALVRCVDILISRGIVQFLFSRPDNHIVVRQLAIIDLGPGHSQFRVVGSRGDVTHPEIGQALLYHFVHRAENHTRTMRVDQMAVDPGLRGFGQLILGNLPRNQRHLAGLLWAVLPLAGTVAQLIAIDVHIVKGIVQTDLLQLAVGTQ